MSGVEWAGGVGLADRENNTPVTADTHFRVGSISKSFIASALVQLYLDDAIDLDAPVSTIAPEIRIDNAWDPAHPVRVIHLLQHTAGFDDMHFNEMYNVSDPPDMPLGQVLAINPSSRVVRWEPGTRMSYSNPGYAVAGYLIEKVTGEKYEDRHRREDLQARRDADEQLRPDQGRRSDPRQRLSRSHGPPVPYTRSTFGRPAISTPRRSSSANGCTCC
jgi:CubicO group peptidase (beta-lactamase class C family)